MGIQWKQPFSAPPHSSQSTPDVAAHKHPNTPQSQPPEQAASLSSLLRSSSRKDPCNRLYRKAALLPDSSSHSASSALSGTVALQNNINNNDMTYPPSAPYRRDAEARASRSASNVANGTSGGPVKTMSPHSDRPGASGRYTDYNDISDDDDSHVRSPVTTASHPSNNAQDGVSLQRQAQQRMISGATNPQQQPEHWVPAPASHSLPNGGGPHPPTSGGVRGPSQQAPGPGPGPNRGRPPSYSGGRPDELAVSGPNSGGGLLPPSNNHNSARPQQRTGPAPSAGGQRRQHNSRSPPERRSGTSQPHSSNQNGGPPPTMLNTNNSHIQRLPTPSVAASVLHPLEQKVTEYSNLMREAEDQVDRLDDEIRALQERRAAAESRYMEAKARHDEYRSQHADVERALRGDLPPLEPMLSPLPQGQAAPGGGARVGSMTTQQLQQQHRMQQRGSLGSLHEQYHYEHERSPQDNINMMNRRKQSAQYERPLSSSSAGGSLRDGNGKKGKGKFRFSLFG